VFRFLQREGRSEDASRDLAQSFFARLLASTGFARADPTKGRFRSFLIGALKHFLADQREHDDALKRGGGVLPESLDEALTPEIGQLGCGISVNEDAWFDRQWAFAVMDRALKALATEHDSAGNRMHFERLKPWLVGPAAAPSNTAEQLGWTEGALKVAVHRLRKRFRELVRAEVAQTVPASADIDEELRYLVDVLARTS
jgi:RNA polymerase sigma-70 factor (ECF subfamily)